MRRPTTCLHDVAFPLKDGWPITDAWVQVYNPTNGLQWLPVLVVAYNGSGFHLPVALPYPIEPVDCVNGDYEPDVYVSQLNDVMDTICESTCTKRA